MGKDKKVAKKEKEVKPKKQEKPKAVSPKASAASSRPPSRKQSLTSEPTKKKVPKKC